MLMLKVGETHDLEDECYLKSEIALLCFLRVAALCVLVLSER